MDDDLWLAAPFAAVKIWNDDSGVRWRANAAALEWGRSAELRDADWRSLVERLEAIDNKARSYSYTIVEGPLPVARYRSTLHVSEKADGRGCTVEWSSDFEPSGASESDAVKAIRGVYEAGFDNLRKMFGG